MHRTTKDPITKQNFVDTFAKAITVVTFESIVIFTISYFYFCIDF